MPVGYADIAGLGSADVQTTFKRIYTKAVDAVPVLVPLTAQMEKTTKYRAGPDGVRFNVKVETGGPIANVPDAKLLPTPASTKRKAGSADLVHTYTTLGIGGQSIALTSDTRQAFVSNMKDQMKDRMDLLSLDLERQYNGDGDGILCQIETVASAPTYDVRYPYNINGGGPGTMLLIEGMEVACINPSGGAERDRAVIESVDTANEQITLSASLSSAAIGDYLVLCNDVDATGTDQANNYQAEANGILAAIAEGDTFLGIDGSSVRRWNANVISSSGAITEKKIATLEARVRAASGKRAKLHYTTRGISIELQDQLAGLRRFSGEQTTLKGGYEGVNIGGRDVLEGDFCPKGYYFVICTSADEVGMLDLVKRGFIDLDGAELHRIEGRHAYRADLWFPHNAIWFSRNAHGALTGLDDDNTIVR